MFARTMPHRARRGCHTARGFLRLLLLILPALACLIPSADRARACIGSDGKLPPWGKTQPNGIMVDQINLAHAIAKANGEQTPVTPPISGTHKVVIILVENAANGATFTSAFRSGALWSNRITQFDTYYNQVSRGMLRIAKAAETFGTANDGVIGPVTIPSLRSTTSGGDFAAEAVRAANPYINFAAFDTNGDGKITATELHILIYQAGYEGAYGGNSSLTPNAWGHTSWNTGGIGGNNPATDSDGKKITSYCYAGSIFSSTLMASQGVMTHELGHDLGLPDLYDTDGAGSGGVSETLGMNCLMGSGNWGSSGLAGSVAGDTPVHIDAYYKNWLGWENQVTVTSPVNQTRSLLAANGNNQSLRINVTGSNEFFLVENRQQTGFDAGMPGTQGGLVIYHCDGTILNGGGAVNNNPGSLGISVEEADGDYSMTRQTGTRDRGQDTDYFRAGNKTSFNNTTTPNSNLKSGAASSVNVWGIGVSGNPMTFNVGTIAPRITYFRINYDAATTENRNVTLNSTCDTSPATYYMASESSSFAGAVWKPWSGAVSFTLSAGNVTKTVYFKVENSLGQISTTASDSIGLEETVTLPLSTGWTASAIGPVGDMDWFKFTVTTAGRYAIETSAAPVNGALTKDYLRLYGPNSRTLFITEDNGASGTRMARIERTLAAGTYYVRCSAYNTSDQGAYSIRVYQMPPPVFLTYGINNGANYTASRTVLLNNTAINAPTEYMASEIFGFTGGTWLPYSTAPRYTITGTGDGLKTVYIKLRNAAGESIGWSDYINLKSITLNALIVYNSNTTVANDVTSFLKARGITSTAVSLRSLTTTSLKPFQVIIVCDDTGSLSTWGTSTQVTYLSQSGKPIVGLGEGGYAFFGKLALNIGYGNGAWSSETAMNVVDKTHTAYNLPHDLATPYPTSIGLYSAVTTTVGIYLPKPLTGVVSLGRKVKDPNYCTLACEGSRYTLWGYCGAPAAMTVAGKDLFENVVRFTAGLGTW